MKTQTFAIEKFAENVIECQRPLAQHYHDILGKAVRKSLSTLTKEQIEDLRLSLMIKGSVWILARVEEIDRDNFYDVNQKILIFKDQIFRNVKEVRPYPILGHEYNVQVRISTLNKFLV